MMKSYLSKWWSPLVGHSIGFLIFVVIVPYALHQIHHIHNLTLGLIVIDSFCILIFLARIHGFQLKTTIAWIFTLSFFIWYSWPKEQLGNWNLQLADHLLLWMLFAFIISAIFQSIFLFRRKS